MEESKAAWGTLGILYAVALVVGTILVIVGGLSEQDVERESFAAYSSTMADSHGVLLASMWAFSVGHVLLVGYVAHLYVRAREAGVAVAWAAGNVALAALLFLVETLLTIGVIDVAAPYAVDQGFDAGHPFVATVDTLMTVRNVTALVAGGLLALGAVLIGVASRRGEFVAPWLALAAGLVGVVGLLGLFYPLVEGLSYVRQIGIMLFALWAAVEGAMGLGAKGHVAAE